MLRPDTGAIEFGGQSLHHLTPDTAAAAGIAISYQHPAILDDLSVLENLRLPCPPAVFDGRPARGGAGACCDSVGLDIPLDARCDTLTVAQKQLLEIAKALALKPKLLILDEPTASLDQDATDMLFARVREVDGGGDGVSSTSPTGLPKSARSPSA